MRTWRWLAATGAVLWMGIAALPQEKPTPKVRAVTFGRLWDGQGKVWTNATVVIEGDRIKAVTTDRSAVPQGAERIDLSRYTGCRE